MNNFLDEQRKRLEARIRYCEAVKGPHAHHKRELLPHLRRALGKLAVGTYETCDNCGEKIPRERLRVVPGALYCWLCQHVHEHNRRAL